MDGGSRRNDGGGGDYNGPVVLKKGLAELVMESEPGIIIQGPIKLNIESPSIFMNEGRIAVSYERKEEILLSSERQTPCCGFRYGIRRFRNSDGRQRHM